MSNPHIPNPSPTPPGGAGWSTPAPGQFAGAAQGVPYQGGGQPMPAPQAWGAPGPYPMARPARPQLSTRVRVCLRIELVMWVIALVNVFTPYFFDDLRLYLLRFTDIWFYQWFFIYAVLIALSAIALVGRNAVVRYVLVGVVLVFFLLINPVLSVAQGGQWYALFTPPTLDPSVYGDDWSASLLLVRSLVIWLIVRTGIVTAIVLAVPDRRTPAAAPVGGPFVAAPMQGGYPAPGGAVPPHGVNPVAPQGMWPAPAQGGVPAPAQGGVPAAGAAPAQGIPQPGAGAGSPDQ
ncbi:hypothetical protein [Actinomyces sp.]